MQENRKSKFGTIEERNGKFRARKRVDGKMIQIGSFCTWDEAEGALGEFSDGLLAARPTAGHTLATWGAKWLDERELDGIHRNVARERHVWKRIAKAHFIDQPLVEITRANVLGWVRAQLKEGAARQTVFTALCLLRVCLQGACETDPPLLDTNVARDLRVPKVARTKDAWTWLKLEEVAKLLTCAELGAELRDLYAVAIYTGLRAGELFGLQRNDVDLEAGQVRVRYSWRGTPTKTGEPRTVALFGPALDALARQLARHGYRPVFPAADGAMRTKDQAPDFAAHRTKAGIMRHVRFHDLRHTCASHLVSGSWGRPWTLEETAAHLGHSSSAMTRRYAHLCPTALRRAVAETRPELYTVAIEADPKGDPSRPQTATRDSYCHRAKSLKSAEGTGFEPAVKSTPHRISNPHASPTIADPYSKLGTRRGRAIQLLEQLRDGVATQGSIAEFALEIIGDPPAEIVAARRFLDQLGAADVGLAAVGFLEAVVTAATAAGQARARGPNAAAE